MLSGIGVATEAVLRREDSLDINSFFDQGINNVLTVLNLSARDGRFGERDQGNLINSLSRKAPAIFSKSVRQLGAGHLVSDYTRLIAEHRNPLPLQQRLVLLEPLVTKHYSF